MDNTPNLTLLITSKCTLKCKLCATYTPLKSSPCHYAKEAIIKSVERFFECIDHVNLFTLSGGEPFLHPDLDTLLLAFQKYVDNYNKFEIITNGTVVPTDRILKLLQFSGEVDIMIDDYGPDISVNVPRLTESFNKYKIKYRVRRYYGQDAHLGGWLDISDFSQKNRTLEEIEELFSRCMYMTTFKNHFFIINGTAHMCYVNHQLLDFIEKNPGEYVNMLDDSLSKEQIKMQLFQLRERKCLSVCSCCNGFLVDGKRYAPAEQLS